MELNFKSSPYSNTYKYAYKFNTPKTIGSTNCSNSNTHSRNISLLNPLIPITTPSQRRFLFSCDEADLTKIYNKNRKMKEHLPKINVKDNEKIKSLKTFSTFDKLNEIDSQNTSINIEKEKYIPPAMQLKVKIRIDNLLNPPSKKVQRRESKLQERRNSLIKLVAEPETSIMPPQNQHIKIEERETFYNTVSNKISNFISNNKLDFFVSKEYNTLMANKVVTIQNEIPFKKINCFNVKEAHVKSRNCNQPLTKCDIQCKTIQSTQFNTFNNNILDKPGKVKIKKQNITDMLIKSGIFENESDKKTKKFYKSIYKKLNFDDKLNLAYERKNILQSTPSKTSIALRMLTGGSKVGSS